MNFDDLNCNYQRLDNKEFRIKFKTGNDIFNAANHAIAGEMFVATGDNGALYFATQTSDGGNDFIYKAGDLPAVNKLPPFLPSIMNSYATSFDGNDDYVDTGIPTDFQGSASMSLSFWFKSNTAGEGPSIGARVGSSNQWGFLRAGSTNYVQIITAGNGKYFSFTSPADTDYHHYLLTFSSGAINLYIDGSLVSVSLVSQGNGVLTNLHSENVSFNIGKNDTFHSHGLFDEVALFNKVFHVSVINAIYNNGLPNDISSLNPVGWWRMGDDNAGAGTTITDQGSGGNDGTLINGPTFSTDVPS